MKNLLINTLKRITIGLSYLVVILFMIAIILYIIESDFGKSGEPVGFQLAIISSILGGFILTSAFFDRASSGPSLRLELRRIGVLYLIATIAFVVYGICFPIIDKMPCIPHITAIGMVVGAMSFAMGTVLLGYEIPRLLRGLEK